MKIEYRILKNDGGRRVSIVDFGMVKQRTEDGDRKQERQKIENGGQRTEIRDQKAEG